MNGHQLEDRDEESLGLPEREVAEQTQGERGFDRQVGVLRLATATFGGLGVPVVDGVLRNPKRDAAALDEGLVVLGPVGYSVLGLVLRVDSGSLGRHGSRYRPSGRGACSIHAPTPRLVAFRRVTLRVWQKWLNRRSRGNHMPWSRYLRLLERFPLPRAQVVHSVFRRVANPCF